MRPSRGPRPTRAEWPGTSPRQLTVRRRTVFYDSGERSHDQRLLHDEHGSPPRNRLPEPPLRERRGLQEPSEFGRATGVAAARRLTPAAAGATNVRRDSNANHLGAPRPAPKGSNPP